LDGVIVDGGSWDGGRVEAVEKLEREAVIDIAGVGSWRDGCET
jgi:hypothetical protein